MRYEPIPDAIIAAGADAVRVYRAYLADPVRVPNTRRVYRHHILRFFAWAEARDLPLTGIAPRDIAAYIAPLQVEQGNNVVSVLRGLFAALVAAGVLSENPCGERGRPPADAAGTREGPDAR